MTIARRAAAEALASAGLLAAIVGSGIMGEQLAMGNTAVALLANTLATACALAVLIAVFGPVSGAHMNPLVSIVASVRGQLPVRDVVPYVGAQVVGAVVGVWTAHAMFAVPVFEVSSHVRSGTAQTIAEAVATFGLILLVELGARVRPSAMPALVAAYIASAYWFTRSTSFANPAVTFARALTDTFAGIRPADVPHFWLGQVIGAAGAVMVSRWFTPSQSMESA